MKEGASDYILKPFSTETLEKAIKKVCENSDTDVSEQSEVPENKYICSQKRIITKDPKFSNILSLAKSIAASNATVLILGESGTGKELLASYIHENCKKKNSPYIAVNCAALPENLIESELFGHEKGAFTGANSRKIGKFEAANGGTVVLDEISEMPYSLQAKLLRVLQEREINRVGGNTNLKVDVRVIAISNVDLALSVKEGKFREDLFYRINVVPLKIPPLRDRKIDIKILAEYFIEKYCKENNKNLMKIDSAAFSLLNKYKWPGNVRELENVLARAVILNNKLKITNDDLFLEMNEERKKTIEIAPGMSVKEMEEELICKTLREVNGNRTHAADMLGISIRTLRNKLKEYKGDF
jgi:two-component system response regulator FlrC